MMTYFSASTNGEKHILYKPRRPIRYFRVSDQSEPITFGPADDRTPANGNVIPGVVMTAFSMLIAG